MVKMQFLLAQITNPLKVNTIQGLISAVISYFIALASPIVVILVIWGGYQILTSGGDPEKAKEGRDTIFWAMVGLAVILMAYGITAVVKAVLGVQ